MSHQLSGWLLCYSVTRISNLNNKSNINRHHICDSITLVINLIFLKPISDMLRAFYMVELYYRPLWMIVNTLFDKRTHRLHGRRYKADELIERHIVILDIRYLVSSTYAKIDFLLPLNLNLLLHT